MYTCVVSCFGPMKRLSMQESNERVHLPKHIFIFQEIGFDYLNFKFALFIHSLRQWINVLEDKLGDDVQISNLLVIFVVEL